MLAETLTEAAVQERLQDSERLAADYAHGDPWPAELPVAGFDYLWWRFGLGYGGYRLAIKGTSHDLRHVILDRRSSDLDDEQWVTAYAAEFGHTAAELWACLLYAEAEPAAVEAQIARFLADNEAYWSRRGEQAPDLRAPYGRTKTGRPVDDDLVLAWAVEAEHGYDVSSLRESLA